MSDYSLTEMVMAWEDDADEETVAIAKAAIERGAVEWRWDPMMSDVAGLVDKASPNHAYVVIYGDLDWETGEDFYALRRFKFIVAGNGYWGGGDTLAEAKREFTRQGGRLSHGYAIAAGPGLKYVDPIGRVVYDPSMGEFTQREVKPRKVRR